MVFWPNIQYVIFAGLIFIMFFILTPFVYTFWFDQFKPMVPNTVYANHYLLPAGDLLFRYWQIFGYLIPGIVIGWGFASAARSGTQEQSQGYIDEGA